jgi:hypothetical protein
MAEQNIKLKNIRKFTTEQFFWLFFIAERISNNRKCLCVIDLKQGIYIFIFYFIGIFVRLTQKFCIFAPF